jgi:hypothetical protein
MPFDPNLVTDLLNFEFPPNYPFYISFGSVDGEVTETQNLNTSDDVKDEFQRIVESILRTWRRALGRGNLNFVEYEAGMQLDTHEAAYLDTVDYPTIAERINAVHAGAPNFDRDDEEFKRNLRFISIAIDDNFKTFRVFGTKNELRQSKVWGILWRGNVFDTIDGDGFFLDPYVDCIYYHGLVLIVKTFNFETIFDFYQLIETRAEQTLATLQARIPIANFDMLVEVATNEKSVQRKLGKIANKAYLQEVTLEDIKLCLEDFPNLSLTFEETDDGEALVFDRSVKWEFLKLLDDAYLGSRMTGKHYAADSKREQD